MTSSAIYVDGHKDPDVPDRWTDVTMSSTILPWGGGTNRRRFDVVTLTGTYVSGGAQIEECMLRLRCSGCVFVYDSHVPATPADYLQVGQEMVAHMGQCRPGS